jgi:predicted amidohydrolase
MSSYRIALVSMKHVAGDVAANLARHRYWLDRALVHNPDFVGFPEFSLTGWIYDRCQALSLRSAAVRDVEALARRHNICLATSLVERRGGRLHNTCVVAGPAGRIGVMRKVNLVSSEAAHYAPGREFPVFDLGPCRLGVATCADATRYEMIHLLSLRGAEVIFAPHANSLGAYGNCRSGWCRWRMERWPLFASDCRVAIAGMSCAGLSSPAVAGEEATKYCGGGMIMDWHGKPLAALRGTGKREGLIVAEVDLDALRKARADNTLDREFRPAIVYNRRRGWAAVRP